MLKSNDTDCLTITGEPGIGKTEMALQVCHYMGERNEFSAIFFADCRDAVAYQGSIPTSGGLQAHIQRFFELVSEALDIHPAARSPGDLWTELWESAKNKIRGPPFKILLVLDAVNALIDGGGREAYASLGDFVDQLCDVSSHLKLLVTSENSLQKMTGGHIDSRREQVHEVIRLGERQLAMLLLNVYPRSENELSKEMNMIGAKRPKLIKALEKKDLIQLVDGNPGVLLQVSTLLATRSLDHAYVKKAARRYRKQIRENKNMFSSKRANEILQAENLDRRCMKIWLWAISSAAEVDLNKGYGNEAYYRHVPWDYLSIALNEVFCESQTAYNDVRASFSGEDHSWSESSSRSLSRLHRFCGSSFDSSFCARDLGKEELKFIRDLLRKSMRDDGNNVDGSECGSDTWGSKNSTCNARRGGGCPKDGQEEWFSLEAFARFSRKWMAPSLDIVSNMRKDWAMTDPVKVHGFISRKKAKSLLLEMKQLGVFMLRFSASRPGHLILDVTCKDPPKAHTGHPEGILEIKESLVTVSDNGRWTLHYDGNSNDGNTYESLAELVNDTWRLQTLYPNIPKATAFSNMPLARITE